MPPISITIDEDRFGPLARVDRGGECGYVHLAELSHVLKTCTDASPTEGGRWIDLLGSLGIAIKGNAVGDDVVVVFSRPREEVPIRWAMAGATLVELGPVSIPPRVWKIRFVNGRYRGSRIFTTVTRVMSLEDRQGLFLWPYGHAYPDGHICWGTTSPDTRLSDPLGIDAFFLSTPFNGDVASAHSTTHPIQFGNFQDFITRWKLERSRRAALT